MNYLLIVCLVAVINRSCDAYEYLYDQDDTDVDLSWLDGNQLYGNGYRNFEFNGDFDDYVPHSYSKSVHYRPIVSYHPRSYYVDDPAPQLAAHQWNDGFPLYLSHETLPHVHREPVYFAPPTTEQPSSNGYHYPAPETKYLPPNKGPIQFAPTKTTSGYHYPAPETKYLPPNKGPVPFAPIKKSDVPKAFSGYHYPAPETKYLPPNKGPVPFAPIKKPDVPKTVYLPPTTVYLPPTRKPTTATPKTTVPTSTTTRRTTTTSKPSTPKSLYLPPIEVPEPSVVSEYLPPARDLSSHLQPPPISANKPILFN